MEKTWSYIRKIILILCFLSGFGFFVVFWIILYDANYLNSSFNINLEYSAHIGSFLGGVAGSLWTVAGILLLYETFVLQRKEFSESRKAINYSQSINIFLKLIESLNNIVNKISGRVDVDSKKEEKQGVDFLHYAFLEFQKSHNKKTKMEIGKQLGEKVVSKEENTESADYKFIFDNERLKNLLDEAYEEFYKKYDNNLGHYFRFIYNILKFIIRVFPNDTDTKQFLIGLIQAQLSNDELGLLFYNALSKHGRNKKGDDKFRQWLDEFSFFENIDKRCVFIDSYTEFYPKTSFKYQIQENA